MARNKKGQGPDDEPQVKQPTSFAKQAPIRVSFSLYIISITVVAIVVFVLMLVQYLPGYRQSSKINAAVENADYVKLQVLIPETELKKKDADMDVFLKEKEVDLTKLFKGLGVKKVDIQLVESSYYEEQLLQLEKEQQNTQGESTTPGDDTQSTPRD